MSISGITRAFSAFLSSPPKSSLVRSFARLLGGTSVSQAPCRYDDPVIAARRSLIEKKLDRHAFPKWQDLLNHYTRYGDQASMEAVAYFAHLDGEIVSMPQMFTQPTYTEGVYKLGDFRVKVPDNFFQEAKNRYDVALHCLYMKQLDKEYFNSWSDLVDFFYGMDDSRLMTIAIDLKHQEQLAKNCDTEHYKNVQRHIGTGDTSVS